MVQGFYNQFYSNVLSVTYKERLDYQKSMAIYTNLPAYTTGHLLSIFYITIMIEMGG